MKKFFLSVAAVSMLLLIGSEVQAGRFVSVVEAARIKVVVKRPRLVTPFGNVVEFPTAFSFRREVFISGVPGSTTIINGNQQLFTVFDQLGNPIVVNQYGQRVR